MKLFKRLDEEEKKEYKKWAKDNYTPLSEIKGVWHPEVQKECVRINEKEIQEPWFQELAKAASVLPDLDQPPT